MALSIKERFARLDMSKLPNEYKEQFEAIKEGTENFSDDDLIEVFAENFNDLYELTEKRHPEAINTGTGKVIKKKSGKVKKVKAIKKDEFHPKTEEEFALPGKIEKEIKGLKKKLSPDDIELIEMTLTNDEASTDEEMVEYFIDEVGLTENQAKRWVKLRNKYLNQDVYNAVNYSTRTELKKQARKEKDMVETKDGHKFNRKDPSMKGKKFYDENGKQWTCKGYSVKLDECIMEDSEGKEISSCLKDMYVHNPVSKRNKGNMVDDCKDVLKEAGYTVKEQKSGKKKIRRKEPRPEKTIIKERVENTFTPIVKDLSNSEEKQKENKEVLAALDRVQNLFIKLFNRLSNLADDGKVNAIEKIEKLLNELLGE